MFSQITIIGTGLIGGSFGLAVKKHGFQSRVIGCDRQPVLDRAMQIGAINVGIADAEEAIKGSDLVLLATPVGTIIDLIERIGPLVPTDALLTDVGSTKLEVVSRARAVFGQEASRRFLPGHPMAGKEFSGIEHASADLFSGNAWLITPPEETLEHRARAFLQLLKRIGARVITMQPEKHDHVCAWVSHLPQMISTALAATLADEFDDDSLPVELGGRALREMTRIASSPYSMWRDIALTNTENMQQALVRVEQALAHLRENLKTRELEAEFRRANRFRKPTP
jgi:prephenate dehydrogenase